LGRGPKAIEFLKSIDYPMTILNQFTFHRAHSFSANVSLESLEAQIVQDAVPWMVCARIGCGIARCMQVSGAPQ